MRIIITGGTGLIGRALTASLSADKHEVTLLSRRPDQPAGQPANVQMHRWDGKTSEGWGHLVDGADAVVNLAGESIGGTGFLPPRWTNALKQRIMESRRDAGAAVVEAVRAARNKPGVVIQASAIGFYGPHADEVLTEDSPAGNDFPARVCVQWEQYDDAFNEMGVRHAVIRTGLVLDRHDGVLPRVMLPFKLFAGGPLGSGKQYMSWIHIADQVGAMRLLMESKSPGGVFNLTAPNPVTSRIFASTLGRVMSRPSFMPAPAFAFKLAFGEVATIVVDGQRVLPERLTKAGYRFQFDELEPALRDLL
jgi:uncharacterized protein